MLSNPTSGRRTAGRLLVLATVAVVLPLTATRAVNYVDLPVFRPAPAVQAAVSAAAVAVQADEADARIEAQPALDAETDSKIVINGEEKRWADLTAEEKADIRRSIAEAKAEIARTSIDRAEIQRDIQKAMAEARIDKDEVRREMAAARAGVEEAMRQIDMNAAELRRSGEDPERIKASVRESLRAIDSIDVEAITRQAMNSVDQAAIEASVAAAEQSIARSQAEIERLERRLEKEE